MYVVQASPFSKIFTREWGEKCLHKPELIGLSERGGFTVTVPRSFGAIRLKHLVPVHAATLVVRNQTDANGESLGQTRKIEDDEMTPLVDWLTSERSEQTHIYGIVAIDIGKSFEEAMQEMMALAMQSAESGGDNKDLMKKQAALQKQVAKDIGGALETARAEADRRVKHALSITHSNLLKSWEALKTDGKGTYAPSLTEALGQYVIKAEIDRKLELNRRLYNSVASGIPGAAQM